jgi:hypothetical protein
MEYIYIYIYIFSFSPLAYSQNSGNAKGDLGP